MKNYHRLSRASSSHGLSRWRGIAVRECGLLQLMSAGFQIDLRVVRNLPVALPRSLNIGFYSLGF